MKKIIIRADDLGYSKGVNYGILDAVKGGLIKNVSVMMNMPWIEHGYDLIKNEDLCLGVHANVTGEKPLSDPKSIPSLVTKDGKFNSSTSYRKSDKDPINKDEVVKEITEHVLAFKRMVGRLPDYLDVHAVLNPSFSAGVREVAANFKLPFVDVISGNVYGTNTKVSYLGGTCLGNDSRMEVLKKQAKENEAIPLFAYHPGYVDEQILQTSTLAMERPMDEEFLTSKQLRGYLKDNKLELMELKFSHVSY